MHNSKSLLRRICLLAPMLLGLSDGQVAAKANKADKEDFDFSVPPGKLDGEPTVYARLRNDQGWRIKKGRYQGKILQRDHLGRNRRQHRGSQWKLKNKPEGDVKKVFDKHGNDIEKRKEEVVEDTCSNATCAPSNGPQVPISHVVAVAAVCVLAPQLLPAVEVIEAVAANYLLFAQRLFEQ